MKAKYAFAINLCQSHQNVQIVILFPVQPLLTLHLPLVAESHPNPVTPAEKEKLEYVMRFP